MQREGDESGARDARWRDACRRTMATFGSQEDATSMAEAKGRAIAGRLELVGRSADEETPRLSVSVIDANGRKLATAPVDADGSFSLPARARNAAAHAFIGPTDLDPDAEPDRGRADPCEPPPPRARSSAPRSN